MDLEFIQANAGDRSGWTPQAVAEHALPALTADYFPLETSADVFSWDPI